MLRGIKLVQKKYNTKSTGRAKAEYVRAPMHKKALNFTRLESVVG